MDNEMKNKVNEALKAHGMKELSLDEMDRVSGGLSLFYQEIRTQEDIEAVCEIAETLEKQWGSDQVRNWIKQETNDPALCQSYDSLGVDGLYERLSRKLEGKKY